MSNIKKICHKCGMQNPDNAFWCKRCNTRLVENLSNKYKEIKNQEENNKYSENVEQYQEYLSNIKTKKIAYHSNAPKLKIFSFIFFIAVIIILTAYLFSNINIRNSMGLPTIDENIPRLDNGLPWDNNNLFSHKQDFSGIGEFGKDYWFEGNKLKTNEGWTFSINKIQDYSLEGIVLDFRVYEKNEFIHSTENIFSPIDIFIGIDDIEKNPSKYSFTTTSYDDRVILYNLNSGSSNDYFIKHVDNNHIIPHNQNILDSLKKINVMYHIEIQGSLVSLRGEKDNQIYRWESDTEYGNQNCQLILVDTISFN